MDKPAKQEDIRALIAAIEEAIGSKITGPKNFNRLMEFIKARTGEYISTTTLKRVWGYLDEPLNTRYNTLSTIARAIGYGDFNDFLQRNDNAPSETKIPSGQKYGKMIDVITDLRPGDRVELFWTPGRECMVRYIGDMNFIVESSKLTRLKSQDTFRCHLILAGHPLYISGLRHGNAKPTAYICGKIHGGIQFILHPHEPSLTTEVQPEI